MCGRDRLHVVSTRVGGVPEVLPQHMIRLAKPNVDGAPPPCHPQARRRWLTTLDPLNPRATPRPSFSGFAWTATQISCWRCRRRWSW